MKKEYRTIYTCCNNKTKISVQIYLTHAYHGPQHLSHDLTRASDTLPWYTIPVTKLDVRVGVKPKPLGVKKDRGIASFVS